jgi:hypothetical protein
MTDNRISLLDNSVEEIFKNFVIFDGDTLILKPSVDSIFIDYVEKIVGKEFKVLYIDFDVVCWDCNVELSCNGTDGHWINKIREVRKQKYICPKCGYSYITKLDFMPKGCNYTIDIQEKGLQQGLIEYKSLEKVAETINEMYGCAPSRQTVLNHMNVNSEKYLGKIEREIDAKIKKEKIDFSGVYNYDEQYVFINGELTLRLTILDNKTRLVVAYTLINSSNFNKKVVENFIHSNLDDLPLKGIITDGANYYPEIIDNLGVPHQQCTFHKMQNLMNLIYKKINKNNLKIRKRKEKTVQLEKKIQKLENNKGPVKKGRINKNDKKRIKIHEKIKKLKKQVKKLKKEIKKFTNENKEFKFYIDKISRMFKSKTSKTAQKRFNKLFDNLKNLPDEIETFIKKLSKNFQRAINHSKYTFLSNTNNLIELFYGITLPKQLKRKYRTIKGLQTRLRLSKIRWNQRNVLKIKALKQ